MKSLTESGNVSSSNIVAQNISTTEKNYTLNIDRTLMKKIKATNRHSIEYKYTDGGITATLDAISFELFKLSLSEYYSKFPASKGVIETHFDKDKKGNVVQVVYKVKLSEGQGYTINLYTTRSSALINGKSTDYFMHNELKHIHQIMSNVKFNNQKVDIASMNKILQGQLIALLNTENQADKLVGGLDSQDRKICYACKRNVKTRAILCDTGDHWVHYRCDKLSEEQILSLEQDDKSQYCCKMCSEKSSNAKNKSLTIPKLTNVEENTQTCAEKLLDEQIDCERNECGICSEEILNQDEETCDSCNMLVHINCTVNISGLLYCDGCAASLSQVEQSNEEQHNVSTDFGTEKLCMSVVVNSQVSDNCDSSGVDHGDVSQTSNYPSTDSDCQLNVYPNPLKDTVPKSNNGVPKNSKSNKSKLITENNQVKDTSVKQSDIRQLELKLKKKQDELKTQETKLMQVKDDKLRLESYIQKIEARNDELEQSNRLLRRRIAILEENPKPGTVNENAHSHIHNVESSDTDQMMSGIRDRVTRFVLNRVDQQITMLENSSSGYQPHPTNISLHQPNTNIHVNHTAGIPPYTYPVTAYAQPQNINNGNQSYGFTPIGQMNNISHGPFAFIPPDSSYQENNTLNNNKLTSDHSKLVQSRIQCNQTLVSEVGVPKYSMTMPSQTSGVHSHSRTYYGTPKQTNDMTNANVQESQRPHSVISVDSTQSVSGDGEIIDQYSSGSKVYGYPTETQEGNGKTQNFSENPYQLGMPLQSRPILKKHNEDSLSSKDTEVNSQRQCFLGRGHQKSNIR